MRLIDADEIKYVWRSSYLGHSNYEDEEMAYRWSIDKMPTVDAVPVVRCKDCKYFQSHKGRYQTWRIVNSDGICKYHSYEMTRADDYCSQAERKEE